MKLGDSDLDPKIIPIVLSHLIKKDLHSVAQCSRTLFGMARTIQLKRNRAALLRDALIERNLDKVGELLRKDHSLAKVQLHFRANDPHFTCPKIVMMAEEYPFWLRDEPMMNVVVENAEIPPADVETLVVRLRNRRATSNVNLDTGPHFDFRKIYQLAKNYVDNGNEDNEKDLEEAVPRLPGFVLYAFAFAVVKQRLDDNEIATLDVWAAALAGKDTAITYDVCIRKQCGKFIHLLDRISSMQNSNLISPKNNTDETIPFNP